MLCLFVFRKTWDITIPFADNVATIPIAQSHQPGGTQQAVKNGLTNKFFAHDQGEHSNTECTRYILMEKSNQFR